MIEKYVTDLITSQKLKDSGVEQESQFYWKTDEGEDYIVACNSRDMFSKGHILFSAFTLSELIELCGEEFVALTFKPARNWIAGGEIYTTASGRKRKEIVGHGSTAILSVSNLLLSLKGKDV